MGISIVSPAGGYPSSSGLNTLVKSGIPLITPSSGTIGNNGSLTLTTAILSDISGAYMYFPANAIYSGSSAGNYWVVMSSTTQGTIYNNLNNGGIISEPSNLVPFSTTGPGSYTQTTATELTLASVTIPGGALSKSGYIDIKYMSERNTGAGNVHPIVKWGSSQLYNSSPIPSGNGDRRHIRTNNLNSYSKQRAPAANSVSAYDNSASSTNQSLAINTENDSIISFVSYITDATAWHIFLNIEVNYSI